MSVSGSEQRITSRAHLGAWAEAHIAHLSSQMAVVGQSMQQVEMQLMMQQKQHEDLMKLLVNCMAPQERHLATWGKLMISH